MKVLLRIAVLSIALSIAASTEETAENIITTQLPPEDASSEWGIGAVRDGFEAVNGYFDSFLELLGGRNGVCQYKCRYGTFCFCFLFPQSFLAAIEGESLLGIDLKKKSVLCNTYL